MFDQKCLSVLAVVICTGPALADDRVHIDDLIPTDGQGGFFEHALYPTMDLTLPDGAAEVPAPAGNAVPPPLPFTPHFGLSEGQAPGGRFADGVFYSPAEGVELNAKTGLRDGFRGTLGFTIRF